MKLTKKQSEAVDLIHRHSVVLLSGASRSGKSFLAAAFAIARCLTCANTRVLLVRRDGVAARQTVWSQTWLPLLEQYKRFCNTSKTYLGATFSNGSEIIVSGIHGSDKDRVLGAEYNVVVAEEVSEITEEVFFILRTRLNQVVKQDGKEIAPKIILCQNPTGLNHWTRKHFVLEPIKDSVYIHWKAEDNSENLASNYVEMLKDMPENIRARFYNGQWSTPSGLVFSCFNPDHHIDDNWLTGDVYAGIDWGYRTTAVVYLNVRNNVFHVIGARQYHNKTSDIVIDSERQNLQKCRWITVDVHPENRVRLQQAGILKVTHAHKFHNSVSTGAELVNLMFKKNRLFLSSECKLLIDAVQSYHYDTKADSFEPVKDGVTDHLCDALRYSVEAVRAALRIRSMPSQSDVVVFDETSKVIG